MSLQDIVFETLKANGTPMSAKAIAAAVLASGKWSSTGQTPDATIGARLYMDIKKLGTNSRFVKAGKGLFGLSGVTDHSAPAKVNSQEVAPKDSANVFSFTECAEKVLKGQGKRQPMHYRDIAKISLENGWLKTMGKTPEATMYAQIIQEVQRMRKRGQIPRFVQCGKGMVALSAWDKTGVALHVEQHHKDVRKKLKAKLMELKPEEFEKFISLLLSRMGLAEVQCTKFSGDGGVDVRGKMASLYNGALALNLAIQAKRWKQNVQSPVIQNIRGSLGPHEVGCVITTSDFSKGAREEAALGDRTPITLINGDGLVDLMLEYCVGVKRVKVPLYDLKDDLFDVGDDDDSSDEEN